ncbi:MAG: putative rane protein [Verrucomicrobiaceae bacterium]|nr:putative rane protein [Verrucomicrobiaceae bacterium]
MTFTEIIGLALAAAIAGLINSVAGGGTILTFPVLLFFGTPALVANATSTVALVIGTAGSIFGFREHMTAIKPWLGRFIPVSILGGLIGSILLTRTTDKVFGHLVPFLILFATILFCAQGAFRKLSRKEARALPASGKGVWVAVAFQFAVSIYGGYFGAGIGILMLASLGFLGMADIHEMNALKNLLGSLINVVAAVWFLAADIVDLRRAGVMTVGALVGYYVGARYSQRIPQQQVRRMIMAVGLIISAVMFFKTFVWGAT